MASAQSTFSQQVLAAGTQFLRDVGGRIAVWMTQKSSLRFLWSWKKMIITPGINHWRLLFAAQLKNQNIILGKIILLSSIFFHCWFQLSWLIFLLTPRWELTCWNCAPEVEHKPPEENESKQLGWDMGSKWWHFKYIHKPLQYGHKIC